MSEYAISSANLNGIENGLSNINKNIDILCNNIEIVNSRIGQVNDNVSVVFDEVEALARDFYDFVQTQKKAINKSNSQQELILIRQELDKRFGHYDIVRRTTTGILQADDLNIVKKETISTATEEMMISTPGYWLAPCLVALAAWINDQPDLANRAVKEGLKRNDEKSSLFWALVCRRAGRKSAALKWVQRYLSIQDEEDLDRNTVIILDAFAGGLLGSDSEGIVAGQIGKWLEHLSDKPGFVEQQTKQWSDAISLKKKPIQGDSYVYLRKYSKTWPVLQEIMEGAQLHAEILDYFTGIFDQEASTDAVKAQLDEILDSLVSNFDEVEQPLRKSETYHQLVVDNDGDVDRAKKQIQIEQTALEGHKDFTQLLTDAAMKPDSSHASISTQKLAIALSKDWISNAYNDITAQNRARIPDEIEINVDTFNGKTRNGENESALIAQFNRLIDEEKERAQAAVSLSEGAYASLILGIAAMIFGFILICTSHPIIGVVLLVLGIIFLASFFSKKSEVDTSHENISEQFEKKRTKGAQIIRATLAEVVDFRAEFSAKDGESQKVLDFLDQISPEHYVRNLADSNRKIIVSDERRLNNGRKN